MRSEQQEGRWGKRRIRLNHTIVGGREKLDGKKLKKQKQGLSK